LLPRNPQTGDAVPSEAADKTIDSLCPFCGVGCQVTYHVKDDQLIKVEGRDGPANEEKLCVKGRFGFDYIHHPHRLTKPLIRKPDAPKEQMDPTTPLTHFYEASWEEALEKAAGGFKAFAPDQLAGFGSAKGSNEEAYLFQKAGPHRIWHQQCGSLHAALSCLQRCRLDGRDRVCCSLRTLYGCLKI
jgi:formate dehydrogenase major subunit